MAKKGGKRGRGGRMELVDGLNPSDLRKIHKAVRQVWQWSKPWRLAKARAVGKDGFPRCESLTCEKRGKPVPKVFVDHVEPVGKIGGPDYIARMFIPSARLQCLCKKCHDAKTKEERKTIEAQEAELAARIAETPGGPLGLPEKPRCRLCYDQGKIRLPTGEYKVEPCPRCSPGEEDLGF